MASDYQRQNSGQQEPSLCLPLSPSPTLPGPDDGSSLAASQVPHTNYVVDTRQESCSRGSSSDVAKQNLVRERNRVNQANRRRKMKEHERELEAALREVRERLRLTRERWRRLRHERHTLVHHIGNLSKQAQEQQNDVIPGSPSIAAHVHPTPGAESRSFRFTAKASPKKDHGTCNTLLPKGVVPPLPTADERNGPPEPFEHCSTISFADVARHMLPREFWHQCNFNVFSAAIAKHKSAVCEQAGKSVDQVRWFLQFPFPGVHLSTSAGSKSPECSLSSSLGLLATSLECMFLSREFDLLSGKAGASTGHRRPALGFTAAPGGSVDLTSASRLLDHSRDAPLTPPTAPDSGFLTHLYLRVGANQRQSLVSTVAEVLQPLLRKYRGRLPHPTWKRVCMHCMSVCEASSQAAQGGASKTAASSEELRMFTESSAQQEAGVTGARKDAEGLPWSILDKALVALMQEIAWVVYDMLRQPAPLGEFVGGSSLQQVQARMHEISGFMGICAPLALDYAPKSARRVIAAPFLSDHWKLLQAEKQTMRLFKALELQPDQRAALAHRWNSWTRRRHRLSATLNSSLRQLMSALPSHDQIPTSLWSLLDTFENPFSQHTCTPPWPVAPRPGKAAPMYTSGGLGGPPGPTAEPLAMLSNGHVAHGYKNDLAAELCQLMHELGQDGVDPEVGFEGSPPHAACVASNPPSGPGTADGPVLQRVRINGSGGGVGGGVWVPPAAPPATAAPAAADGVPAPGGPPGGKSEAGSGGSDEDGMPTLCSKRFMLIDPRSPSRASVESIQARNSEDSGEFATTTAIWPSHNGSAGGAGRGAAAAAYSDDGCSWRSDGPRLAEAVGTSAQSILLGRGRREEGAGGKEGAQRLAFLGERLEVGTVVQVAMAGIADAHRSDGMMHYECFGPFWELSEVQNIRLVSGFLELGMPCAADVMRLFQLAAQELRHDSLFGAP